jgi:hypothetical protein
MELQAQQVIQDLQAHKAFKVMLVQLDRKACKAKLAHKALLDQQAYKAM